MMAPGSVGQESIDSMKGMIARDGPHIHVLEGGKVVIAATEADYEAGRGVPFSLYGIKAPLLARITRPKTTRLMQATRAKSTSKIC